MWSMIASFGLDKIFGFVDEHTTSADEKRADESQRRTSAKEIVGKHPRIMKLLLFCGFAGAVVLVWDVAVPFLNYLVADLFGIPPLPLVTAEQVETGITLLQIGVGSVVAFNIKPQLAKLVKNKRK